MLPATAEADCRDRLRLALLAGLAGGMVGLPIGITLIVFVAVHVVAWPARRVTLLGVAVTIGIKRAA
jgi:hypothetical protein